MIQAIAPRDFWPGLWRWQFAIADTLRRAQADALGFALGPSECRYTILASGPYWRLRDYGKRNGSQALLVVSSPIKRPYIWDIVPNQSAVRYCLRRGYRVCLVEWTQPKARDANLGLQDYVTAIAACAARLSVVIGNSKHFVIGHSLGGTLAAMFSASEPESVRGLILLAAPLCFQPKASRFRDALVALAPPNVSESGTLPGSLLSHLSAMASPRTFIWSRMLDSLLSAGDRRAAEIHYRVERWALDEVPVPGKLVQQIIEWLYRENRFCRGALHFDGARIGPSKLAVPMLAVVNVADDVAPLASMKPFIDAMPVGDAQIIEHQGEAGVCLQHLGILVGRHAQMRVWPEIIAWLGSHS